MERAERRRVVVPAFAPEPYTAHDRRSIYQSMRGLTVGTLRSLRLHAAKLTENESDQADVLLDHEQNFYRRFHGLLNMTSQGFRIRCHGDFHLGQVLRTGDDIMFVDKVYEQMTRQRIWNWTSEDRRTPHHELVVGSNDRIHSIGDRPSPRHW